MMIMKSLWINVLYSDKKRHIWAVTFCYLKHPYLSRAVWCRACCRTPVIDAASCHRDLSSAVHLGSFSSRKGYYICGLDFDLLVLYTMYMQAVKGLFCSELEKRVLQEHHFSLSCYLPSEVRDSIYVLQSWETMRALLADLHQSPEPELVEPRMWVWLGMIQAMATAPRGLIDPVIRSVTELDMVRDEVSSLLTFKLGTSDWGEVAPYRISRFSETKTP